MRKGAFLPFWGNPQYPGGAFLSYDMNEKVSHRLRELETTEVKAMKNGIGKRALCLLLAALVCLAMLPMTALAGGSYVAVVNIAEPAQNPTTAAMLYNNGTVGAAYNGASYDSATNTLTLNGFCNASQYIEINNMGNDFKLAVKILYRQIKD